VIETGPSTNAFLAQEPIGKLLLKFSVPCVLSMLVSALYNILIGDGSAALFSLSQGSGDHETSHICIGMLWAAPIADVLAFAVTVVLIGRELKAMKQLELSV
jgi:Na+-driven multidrug efflux pump